MAAHPALEPADRRRQLVAAVAIASGLAYLSWRWGFTLAVDDLWLALPLLLAETWALTAAALFVFSAWRLTVRQPPPPAAGQTVAVLVPTYNEPPEILRATVLGALAVRHDPRPEVWVLDDGDREWAREMADELGARYLVRPAPRTHAKAGNLNHALEHVDAELLLVLDADHVPLPHMLERTLGYFRDPEVAFVQSPQAFFNRGFQHPRESADPLRNEQSLFYDVICRGKDRHNATFWCGSSAIVRRSALLSIGGVATDTVVEDTHTAMLLHARGWRSVYHSEVLALGLAPEEVHAFLTQRGRWARGCFQVLRRDNPLLTRGLGLRQRLHYFSSVSHYLEGPQRLVGAVVPCLTLLTGVLPLVADPVLYLSLFVPQLVLVPAATWAMARGRYHVLEAERHALVRMGTYSAAAPAFLRPSRITFTVTPKGSGNRSVSPLTAVRLQLGLATLAVVAVTYQTVAQLAGIPGRLTPFAYVVTATWAVLAAGLLSATALWAARVHHRRSSHRFPVELEARYSTYAPGPELKVGQVFDLSPFGLGMRVSAPLEQGMPIRVTLPLDAQEVGVAGAVATVTAERDGRYRVGVRFGELDRAAADVILSWCFRHPFGPRFELEADHAQPQPTAVPARALGHPA